MFNSFRDQLSFAVGQSGDQDGLDSDDENDEDKDYSGLATGGGSDAGAVGGHGHSYDDGTGLTDNINDNNNNNDGTNDAVDAISTQFGSMFTQFMQYQPVIQKMADKSLIETMIKEVKYKRITIEPRVEKAMRKVSFKVDYEDGHLLQDSYFLSGQPFKNFVLAIRILNHISNYLKPGYYVLIRASSVTRFMISVICHYIGESGRVYITGHWPPDDELTKRMICYRSLRFVEEATIPSTTQFRFIWDDDDHDEGRGFEFYREWLTADGAFFRHDFCTDRHTIEVKQDFRETEPFQYNF